MRNDIIEEKIYEVMRNIIKENNDDIGCTKLVKLTSKELNCSENVIKKRCGGMNNIIMKFNIPEYYFKSVAKKNINEGYKRKDLNKKLIYEIIRKIYNLNKDISQTKLLHLVAKELNCGHYLIYRICGTKDKIFNELNINIPKRFFNSRAKENISIGVKNSKKFKKYIRERSNNLEYIKNMSEGHTRKDITKEKVHKTMEELVEKYGKDIGKIKLQQLICEELNCSWTPIQRKCGTMNDILNENNNIVVNDLRDQKGKIGINEKQILDNYQQKIGYKIERQFSVDNKYFLDGYIRETNTPIEVDELHHFDKNGNLKTENIIRENIIKEKLSCNDFIRLKDNVNLHNQLNIGVK